MSLSSGTKLGPYEIRSPLGAGGMGEVYRATDTKLGRDVALKVLPAEMAHDPERLTRFRREAKTLAQLDHPNIVTIHSVEECDGVHFLTMQLVEGQPVDRLIPPTGLPVDRIVDIAGALADALASAHEKGIVHRDLKPANVMVTYDGRVKVLDFGLAKDVRPSSHGDATLTSASQTQMGVVMGTPAYMSPEQTSGRPLDHRTDIFSLGVMLHEMATGRRPFEGTSSAELVSAILRDTPPPVTDVRPDLPSDLARIIRRCLEKEPRHRVQTARDVSNEFRDLARLTTGQSVVSASALRAVATPVSGAARTDEGFWVAVLPFKYSGSSAELAALGEGLTEEVITGLSRFSYLRVIARGSTAKYSGESGDIRAIGKELGARYVMEGSLRQAGSKVRIAVQLVDASSGAGLWAETYDRAFTPESTLDLLDEVVPRIVATVGDTQGVLPHSMTGALRNRDPESLSPYEAVLRSFGYHQLVSASEHLLARTVLERTVEIAPDRADCWAMLSWLYRAEYTPGFNSRPDPLGRAVAAARRAIDLTPSNQLAHAALACALFFRREFSAFRAAAQRALALNRMEGYVTAYLGQLLAYSGEWDAGCALAERATQLNPHHPGWYWLPVAWNAYRQHDGQRALELVLKINMPGLWTVQIALAAVYSQVGETALARDTVRDLLILRPDFVTRAAEELAKLWQPDMVEQIMADLRKAGLEIPDQNARPVSAATGSIRTTSGTARADEGFWVAVLPVKYTGASAELKGLADGLSEEIVTGLSRFSYLKVIARSSTAHYANQATDLRTVGKELGARYVMEGSLRQAGTRLRLAVQLVDAVSGAHLWAETYERNLAPESIFELQDELVPRIVSTVADQYGILPRSMSEVLRAKKEEDLSPHEAVLRTFSYFTRITPEEHAVVGKILERAVRDAPDHADSWAMLSMIYRGEFAQGFNAGLNPLDRALAAAQRAVDLAPTHALGHYALATVYFFRKEMIAFRVEAERALALNPLDASVRAYLGLLIASAGEWDRGCQMVESAMQLNPNCPGYFYFARCCNGYRQGKYSEVLEGVARVNMPGYFHTQALRAAALGQLGRREEASKAVHDLLALRPDFAAAARQEYAKWYDSELIEQIIDGLRKAGLVIPDEANREPVADKSEPASAPASGAIRAGEGFWVAVLPFKSTGTELIALAEGLSEEIVTGLSRFSYLRVIARGSTLRFANQAADLRIVGKDLGARYVMEGSLRQAGAKLRVTVQLVDAATGAHLWAETYERAFSPDAIFEVQDDLVPRIVATVADHDGVLPQSMAEALRNKNEDQLTPHEATLRSFRFFRNLDPEEHATAKRVLERAVRIAPNHGDCWALLSHMYSNDYWHAPDARREDLDRALAAARRAVDVAPSNHLSYWALALALYLGRDIPAFRVAADRAIEFNRMDGSSVAFMGLLIALSGDWERGCALAEPASALNPNHAGWHRCVALFNAYNKGDYQAAGAAALRLNMPENFQDPAMRAAVFGQLGNRELAGRAVQELLALDPGFASTARVFYSKWLSPELVERLVDGWRKAGLDIDGAAPAASPSGATRADEGFWVAVLPFKYNGANPDLTALVEGLTADIVTGLSRFSYLRVIARGSTAKYTSESGDIRVIGKELGARYVMEGSLRHAGTRLRLAVQLVDATTGAHLWAENFERIFDPESVFALQDELVPRIVSTIADAHGILPHTMSEAIRGKGPEQLTPYEAVLRSFSYAERINPEEHAVARAGLERAVQLAPGYAYAWAMLSFIKSDEYAMGFNPQPDPLERALQAARRAVELDSSGHRGYQALAVTLFYRKETQAFRTAAERAIALNPMDGCNIAHLGSFIAYAGEWERGCALVEQALQLNPNHPGWYWFPLFFNAYRKRDYQGALGFALKINLPGLFSTHMVLAEAYGQLGQGEEAGKAVQELLKLRPDFAQIARPALQIRFEPEFVEHLIEGLRKAGLEIRTASG